MKNTICEIYLNPNESCDGVYHCGQTLSGYVVLTFYEKQKLKDIIIQILGIGKCEWTEQRRLFHAEEIYLKHEIKISDLIDGNHIIRTGVYTYPFETKLLETLPTSCEGKYGFIRYLASVNIIRPNQPVQTQTIAFTVLKPHNLNASPLFQSPTKKQQCVKFFRFLSMTLDNVSVTATIKHNGYAPGQMIPLQIDVDNKSNKNILEFKVELNKVFVYFDTVRKQSKKHKSPLTSILLSGGCPANTCAVHISEILVPPVPSTDSVSSKILHITYELKIYGNFGGNTMKPLIKLPITIGTVPLYSTYRCVHFEDSIESNHIVPFKYEALLDDYLNLDNSNNDGKHQYAPFYPVFTVRPSKRRQNSEQSLESSSEQSNSE
ncbi:arrestin domain-containing protein 2-like [Contarinia nasturtii]|uniref:arrestin domain-containing protein 2-like n=1 Tax=Contarinia nasturtii TaxID=265458 RepID=UPI0012D3B115|nr:arrestin domain-containing protein 2-like [Contarinia nasturtii]